MLLSWQYDRKPGVGALGIIYHGSRRAGGGLRWKDMKDALCCRICGLTPVI